MGDGDASALGLDRIADADLQQCLVYVCNLAFADAIDTCKNAKFPGTLAVSLSRDMLPSLRGYQPVHKPYSTVEIVSWLNPLDCPIPPTLAFTQQRPHSRAKFVQPEIVIKTLNLDFGGNEDPGLFEVFPVLMVLTTALDFGAEDGLFTLQ